MLKRYLLAVSLLGLLFSLAAAETVEEKYSSGKPKLKYQTDKEGRKDGFYVEYYENGRLKTRAACKANEFEGVHTTFYPSGATQAVTTYKKGKRHGPYTERDEKGKVRFSAVFRDDKLHGDLKHYDKGKEIFKHAFQNGEPVFARTLDKTRTVLQRLAAASDAESKAEPMTAERMAALRRLKAYRFLVGVPYENVELDDTMNRHCEAGAKLCEKIGRLDHTPANPGWPEDEYQFAYKGTSRSNLHMGRSTLSQSVDAYMNDSDPRDIERVGHRRWCINPAMQKTGFGKSGRFSAMWSFDGSQPSVPDYDFISYPSPGYMPIQFFGPRHAWNVSFHPKKFLSLNDFVKAQIYEVDQFLSKVGEPLPLNYHKVNTSGAGVPLCLIFRPEKAKLVDGQRYMVEIQGLQSIVGQPVLLRFLVVFVDLNAKPLG